MARHEQDREDILREATALVERVEVAVPGREEAVVVGFRRNGGVSFFLGADPVYQFNHLGEFRRGYVAGRLLKAQSGQLWAMRRERGEHEVTLHSQPLTSAETAELRVCIQRELTALRSALRAGQCRVLRQVPADREILPAVQSWLDKHADSLVVANRPHSV